MRDSVIRFDKIGYTYPGPPPVNALLDTDLVIERGEYVAVVGPSGSGKSTFLNIIGLLDRPTYGRYELDGINTTDLPEKQRTALRGQRIGFVFQAFHLLPHRTVLENVSLAMLYTGVPRAERKNRAYAALTEVGMENRAHFLATQLSGGQRQRAAIARALVNKPSLLLCDEPTGNLDSATTGSVLALLERVHHQGMTIMVVTHDTAVARRGKRLINIQDGVVREEPGAAR